MKNIWGKKYFVAANKIFKLILILHIRWQYIHYYDNNHNKNTNEQNKILKGRDRFFLSFSLKFFRCNAHVQPMKTTIANTVTTHIIVHYRSKSLTKKKVSHEYFIVSQNKMTFRYKIAATGEILLLLLLFNIIMPSWNSKILPKVLETLQINK